MAADQGVNGVPMCANGFILNRVVRESWDWEGFVVSDCDAINTMMVRGSRGGNSNFGHAYSLNGQMAVQDGVRAGCDSNCGGPYHEFGMQAISEGLVTEEMLDASVRRLLRPHFQLGLFDPAESQPWSHYDWSHVGTTEHQQLALEAARQSIVLVQNPPTAAVGGATAAAAAAAAGSKVLPLAVGSKVVVAGPLWDGSGNMLGNYNGHSFPLLPVWQHIGMINGNASTTPVGAVHDACGNDTSGIAAVVAASKGADAVVLGLGGDCHEGEGTDRDFLHLPGVQSALFKAVLAAIEASGSKTKLVVYMVNGGPIAIDEIKGTRAAVLSCGFPGQAGPQAIAEVLFGQVNPSGKLTTTVYPGSYANGEPLAGTPWMDAGLRPRAATNLPASEGRTHMFYTGSPLWGFGHGLSYTEFELSWARGTNTQVRQRSSLLKAVITAFPSVSLPFLAVPLLSQRTVAIRST
eukprot:SAG22_NODE_407_length_10957_cov_5.081691_7_plen_463_part_00